MQALWSRAAQTRSCRCGPCLQAATIVTRRATTAAPRRRLKAGDVFTACYSAMFATAAVIDAKMKDKRRLQWDELIAQVKTQPSLEEESSPDIHSNAEDPRQLQLTTRALHDVRPTQLMDDYNRAARTQQILPAVNAASYEPSPFEVRQMMQEIIEDHIQYMNAKPTDSLLLNHNTKAEEWANEDDGYREPGSIIGPRDPKEIIHLRKMEQMVAKLVVQLLLNTKSLSNSKYCRLVQYLENQHISGRTTKEELPSTRFPAYMPLDREDFHEEKNNLGRALDGLLRPSQNKIVDADLLIAKVCYNLLVSPAPPSITVYNMLISRLTEMKLHKHARTVIDSFYNDSRFRPNEQTILLILRHFRAAKDKAGFNATIKRMNASHNNMRLRKRAMMTMDVEQAWLTQAKVRVFRGNVYEKAPRNMVIFDTLIQGCIDFLEPKRAIMFAKAAFREGYSISATALQRLVFYCMAQNDTKLAIRLLQALLCEYQNLLPAVAELREPLHHLVRLCGIDLCLRTGRYVGLPKFIDRLSFEDILHEMIMGEQGGGGHVDHSVILRDIELSIHKSMMKGAGIWCKINSAKCAIGDSTTRASEARHIDREQALTNNPLEGLRKVKVDINTFGEVANRSMIEEEIPTEPVPTNVVTSGREATYRLPVRQKRVDMTTQGGYGALKHGMAIDGFAHVHAAHREFGDGRGGYLMTATG